MLALKVTVEDAVAHRGSKKKTVLPRTLVFDEIDIGIGGRAAEAVGQKLKALARTQQVICVTHLPQIAAFADQHFLIEKGEAKGRTQTAIRQMSEDERVREIARMLSGSDADGDEPATRGKHACREPLEIHPCAAATASEWSSSAEVWKCLRRRNARMRPVAVWRLRVRSTAPRFAKIRRG